MVCSGLCFFVILMVIVLHVNIIFSESIVTSSGSLPSDIECAQLFENDMKNLKLYTCKECKEISLSIGNQTNCVHLKQCWKYSELNDMDPGDIPDELQNLSFVEEALIARVHPIISVFKLKGHHQFGYRGNVINFVQDVNSFAKKLPHNIDDLQSIINITTCDKKNNVHNFTVRVAKVRKALIWLKANNPYYSDIDISNENLDKLPDNSNVGEKLITIPLDEDTDRKENIDIDQDDDESEFDETLNNIQESFIPNMEIPTQETLVKNHIDWPTMSQEAIDEFQTVGYIVCAFPTLFPYGKADLREHRIVEIKPAMYFKHLMKYHDQRFAKHATFRFFAYNSIMRWTAIADGNVFVKNNKDFKNITVEKLKNMIIENPNVLKKVMFQGSNLRGTRSYWYARGGELTDMVKQLGLPTIFLTLSCADGHWADLYRMLGRTNDLLTLSEKERRKLVQDNPHLVDMFFSYRVEAFIKHVSI